MNRECIDWKIKTDNTFLHNGHFHLILINHNIKLGLIFWQLVIEINNYSIVDFGDSKIRENYILSYEASKPHYIVEYAPNVQNSTKHHIRNMPKLGLPLRRPKRVVLKTWFGLLSFSLDIIFLRMCPRDQPFRDQLKFKPLNMASMIRRG